MSKDADTSCVQPAGGPVLPESEEQTENQTNIRKENKVLARVGRKAPDFEANAFFEGGFTTVKLSDYSEKWVILCFYPGDFTFV
jgi:hypothetical protein